MHITVKEFGADVDKYLLVSENEDVYITENGKVISMLTNPVKEKSAGQGAAMDDLIEMSPTQRIG